MMIPNAGPKAKEILGNEVFTQAIKGMQEGLIKAARDCEIKDDAGRFRYITALKVIDGVLQHLKVTADLEDGQEPPPVETHYEDKSRSRLRTLLNI